MTVLEYLIIFWRAYYNVAHSKSIVNMPFWGSTDSICLIITQVRVLCLTVFDPSLSSIVLEHIRKMSKNLSTFSLFQVKK